MVSSYSSSSAQRVNDPVITNLVHGYSNSEGIAAFIAPVVNVSVRAGKVVTFGKENFAVMDLARAPGGNVKRLGATYETRTFYLEQHAIGASVPREAYEEALNGETKINLRTLAALRAAQTLEQSWEARVIDKVYDTAAYETANVVAAGGAVTNYDNLIQDAQELVRAQVGRYANSAILAPDVYRAVKRNAVYTDRVKYTSADSVNLGMISSWWDLPRGVKVGMRQKINAAGALVDMIPAGTILLFYNPESDDDAGMGFLPSAQSDIAKPAFAYTYLLDGYPMAEEERFDEDRKTFVTDIIAEQSINLVGLGATGKVGAGALITGITL